MLADLRYAIRSLRNTPGFTALAVVILGLGLGVNATLFTLVRVLLLAPPSGVAEPGRLVRITRLTEYGSRSGSLAYPDYAFYRDENRAFTGIAALGGSGVVLANTGADAVEARLSFVSGNYFAVLGIPFAAGRPFGAPEDVAPGMAPVAVISDRFWRSHLGGDARAVGSSLKLNGHAVTIVGVVSQAFHGLNPAWRSPASGPTTTSWATQLGRTSWSRAPARSRCGWHWAPRRTRWRQEWYDAA